MLSCRLAMDASISQLLINYQLIGIYLGALFFAETAVITAGFLAGQGAWSVMNVFVFALIGTLTGDVLWFLFGQAIFKLFRRFQKQQDQAQHLLSRLEVIIGHRPFLLLLLIKFLYGTRIITIVYLSMRRIPFWKFLIYDLICSSVWLVAMILLGWLAGKGIADWITLASRTQVAFTALVVVVLLVRWLAKWLEKKITNYKQQA